jgi:ribonuclease P protein component
MLSKINRLQKDKDFQKVFKGSKPVHTENLVFRVAEKSYKLSADSYKLPRGARFGFIVSNKVNKRATRRNALKRRLRAAVGALLPTLPRDIDVVVMVKNDFVYPYDFQAIKGQVQEGLKGVASR